MILNEKQKKFLKANKDIIIELLKLRLSELVDAASELNITDPSFSNKAAINLLFIREFKDAIRYIEILSKPVKKEKTTNKEYV